MKKKITRMAILIIASAIIWGAVIVGCSLALRETECYSQIQNILAGGAITHLVMIWGSSAVFLSKKDNRATDEKTD